MEWYDVFRVFGLVVAWAIPAVLILAVVAFIFAAPALTVGGMVLRLYDILSVRLRKKAQAERQSFNLACSVDNDCPPGFVCVNGHCMPEKELLGTKS